MVAIAIGMMPMSACAENLGKVNAGKAKKEPSPSLKEDAASASAGTERNRLMPPTK